MMPYVSSSGVLEDAASGVWVSRTPRWVLLEEMAPRVPLRSQGRVPCRRSMLHRLGWLYRGTLYEMEILHPCVA